jgi:16S rRNA C967 or C1407 C5-methylase (RsmB/RsmF family)
MPPKKAPAMGAAL